MCILPYGHNLNALILFRDALKAHFSETECLACRDLPDYAEQGEHVRRVLSYPYDGTVARAPKRKPEKSKRKSLPERLLSLASQPLPRRAFYTGVSEIFRFDIVRSRTLRDWRRTLKQFKMTDADSIFMPSVDFYGAMTLLEVLLRLPVSERPRVHLRMIGVSENARYSRRPARPELLRYIRRAIKAGIRVSVSAETLTYKTYLERLLNTPVTYLPYPLANEFEPLNWGQPKTVTSPGQAREDKGIYRFVGIISSLLSDAVPNAYRFDVQGMRVTDDSYRARYFDVLRNIPGMLLRPARLSQPEIDDAYRQADILVLPYDGNTYALRGSAVYQEGIAIGRPMVCSRGLGFSDLALRYGNGLLAEREVEFAQQIRKLAEMPKSEVEAMVAKARAAYAADFENGLASVLKEFNP